MAPIVQNPDTTEENLTIFIKGAPEKILSRSSKILYKDEHGKIVEAPIDEEALSEIEGAN